MVHSVVDCFRSVGAELYVRAVGAGLVLALFATPTVGTSPVLTVRALSARPGHLFTDSEMVKINAVAEGASGAVTIRYTAHETDGSWRQTGEVSLTADDAGKTEFVLPLDFPGRGLFHLSLEAVAGTARAAAETWVTVVFTPDVTAYESPWCIFWIPYGDDPHAVAESIRLLGASWARFNFWSWSFGEVAISEGDNPKVTADYSLWKEHGQALHGQGLYLMGEIAQCPRALSSRPDDVASDGDKGPIWARVKPRDYRLWDQLVEKVAADFADKIDVWEIWNEPNIGFWEGTVDEYAELVAHTSAALRRGDPAARIAAGGFVEGFDFADKLFQLGMGDDIDILSVHYTDEKPGHIQRWQALLRQHHLDLPIWNSEEKSEVPLRNMADGIEKSFKFLHIAVGYPEFRPLVRKDLTVLPAGVAFSVGAHCIGTAQPVGSSDRVAHVDTHFFKRGEEMIAAFQRQPIRDTASLCGAFPSSVELAVEPLANTDVTVTDTLGRSEALRLVDGQVSLPLARLFSESSSTPGMLIVNGARDVKITGTVEGSSRGDYVLGEAESGEWHPGWQVSPKEAFFGGRVLEMWTDRDPGPEGYWVRISFELTRGGHYEVIFSGNPLQRLKTPRSVSPFVWSFDDGPEHLAAEALLPPRGFLGSLDGISLLGSVELNPGAHTFQLRLADRREVPDTHYALWFDAIVLRPVTSDEN